MRANEWKLEDAKARFSEVVRRAKSAGPQKVTVRGKEEAVILSVRDYARLAGERKVGDLVTFLGSLPLDGLALEREADRGRDIGF